MARRIMRVYKDEVVDIGVVRSSTVECMPRRTRLKSVIRILSIEQAQRELVRTVSAGETRRPSAAAHRRAWGRSWGVRRAAVRCS